MTMAKGGNNNHQQQSFEVSVDAADSKIKGKAEEEDLDVHHLTFHRRWTANITPQSPVQTPDANQQLLADPDPSDSATHSTTVDSPPRGRPYFDEPASPPCSIVGTHLF
ncbi:unnamed protein product [Vicia faba]|uniref:Uncharacterized protein n=1 Tax=Vicia faba TaxID=3906 RepID=A0AAV1AB48_VICFA|nr:unnamed protein product [Vicia faba]